MEDEGIVRELREVGGSQEQDASGWRLGGNTGLLSLGDRMGTVPPGHPGGAAFLC